MNDRILHVPRRFTHREWGGTETVVWQIALRQKAAGGRPEIHTSRAVDPRPREERDGIPIRRYRYCYPFFGLTPAEIASLDKKGGNLLSLSLFLGLLLRPGLRLIHAHVTKRMGGEALTAARWRRKPCVVHLHGNHFDVPAAEAESLAAAQRGHFEWGRPFGAFFRSRRLLEEADGVICVGYAEYEAARRTLPHDRVHYLPNGVNPAAFAGGDRAAGRSRAGLPEGAWVAGCISRIDPQKNQMLLIEALALLGGRQNGWHLLLAGPVTDPVYEQALRRRLRETGLEESVAWLPAVAPESREQRDLLAALDCFVLPSRHEPFGIVVLEAWAAGLPVAVARVGGLIRLVEESRTGLFFETGDPAGCARVLSLLRAQPSLAAQLAGQGRELCARDYSWNTAHQKLEEIYAAAQLHHSHR